MKNKLRGTYTVDRHPVHRGRVRRQRDDAPLAGGLPGRRGDPRPHPPREQRGASLPHRRGAVRGRADHRRAGGGPGAGRRQHHAREHRFRDPLHARRGGPRRGRGDGDDPRTTRGSTRRRSTPTSAGSRRRCPFPSCSTTTPPPPSSTCSPSSSPGSPRIDNISYIKESTTDTRRVYRINELCGEKMTVFAGYLGYESFMVGAEGWVSVCANIMPRESARMFELAVDEGDREGAWGGLPRTRPR